MRMVFIGLGENGEKCLKAVIKKKFKVAKVITAPEYDNTKINLIADRHKISLLSYRRLQAGEILEELKQVKPDLLVIASFPYLLPLKLINIPKFGSINVHASLLPAYRGYHPLNWAIIRNESYIGVTVHYVDEGMDTGDILAQQSISIKDTDDINSLKNKTTSAGAKLLVKVIGQIDKKRAKIPGIPQAQSRASFAPRRYPFDGKINFHSGVRDVFNLVRALTSPYPMAYAHRDGQEKVEFEKSYLPKKPGQVLAKINGCYLVGVSDGVILLKTKTKLTVGEILV